MEQKYLDYRDIEYMTKKELIGVIRMRNIPIPGNDRIAKEYPEVFLKKGLRKIIMDFMNKRKLED